jgi:hypothetical protein
MFKARLLDTIRNQHGLTMSDAELDEVFNTVRIFTARPFLTCLIDILKDSKPVDESRHAAILAHLATALDSTKQTAYKTIPINVDIEGRRINVFISMCKCEADYRLEINIYEEMKEQVPAICAQIVEFKSFVSTFSQLFYEDDPQLYDDICAELGTSAIAFITDPDNEYSYYIKDHDGNRVGVFAGYQDVETKEIFIRRKK